MFRGMSFYFSAVVQPGGCRQEGSAVALLPLLALSQDVNPSVLCGSQRLVTTTHQSSLVFSIDLLSDD